MIWIPSRASGRAIDRTSAITPPLEAAYSGITGKGYRPALDAVQRMAPREPVSALGVFLAR